MSAADYKTFEKVFVGNWTSTPDMTENMKETMDILGFPAEFQKPIMEYSPSVLFSRKGDSIYCESNYLPGKIWKGTFQLGVEVEVNEEGVHNKHTFYVKDGDLWQDVKAVAPPGSKDYKVIWNRDGDILNSVCEVGGVKGIRRYKKA